MSCSATLLGICLTRPPADAGSAIFGFGEFLAALALLVLVFNSTDHLYRFRIAVAPLPLYRLTFGSIIVIGAGTLMTDLWFAERWYALPLGWSRAELQAGFGSLFLLTALVWMWFAFIRPPTFSRWNAKRFHHTLYQTVVRGAEPQLSIIAAELVRSASCLVELAAPRQIQAPNGDVPKAQAYAHNTLLLIASRKLCRHIVASAPATAIVLMMEASRQKRFDIALGQFASTITSESLRNKDSILFHEDNFSFDLVGHQQPFRTAMYGDFRLVDGLSYGMSSPLDIDWRLASALDAEQFEAYCQIVLLSFKSFVENGKYLNPSSTLYRAFDTIKSAGSGISNTAAPSGSDEGEKRLRAAVQFVNDAIDFLAEQPDLKLGPLRTGRRGAAGRRETVLDDIASLMFELIHSASYVRADPDRAWWVHYNLVWGRLFAFRKPSPVWRIIRIKLFRLIYDEIRQLDEYPNFQGARLLGFCLNISGLSEPKKADRGRDYYALRKVVISWARRRYLWLREENIEVANHCLSGSISFDDHNLRLVKTYRSMAGREPAREFLELDDPPRD